MGGADKLPGGRAGLLGSFALGCAAISMAVGGMELSSGGGLRAAVIMALFTFPLPALLCASFWRLLTARPRVLIGDGGVALSVPRIGWRWGVVRPIQRGHWLEWRERFIPLAEVQGVEPSARGVRLQCRDGTAVDLETWRHGLPALPGPAEDLARMEPRLRQAVYEQRELLLALHRRLELRATP